MFQPPQGPAKHYTEEQLHHIRMLMAEKITMVDKWVGKLLDKIKALGLWDNTLIILTSDHGHPTGHGEHGHGIVRKVRPWPYEELAHIPLLVRLPGVGEGTRNASFVQSVDIAPTIMDYLKTERQATQYGKHVLDENISGVDMQGESLLPLVCGKRRNCGILLLPATTATPGALFVATIPTSTGSKSRMPRTFRRPWK